MFVAGFSFRRDPWQSLRALSRSRTSRLRHGKLDPHKLRSRRVESDADGVAVGGRKFWSRKSLAGDRQPLWLRFHFRDLRCTGRPHSRATPVAVSPTRLRDSRQSKSVEHGHEQLVLATGPKHTEQPTTKAGSATWTGCTRTTRKSPVKRVLLLRRALRAGRQGRRRGHHHGVVRAKRSGMIKRRGRSGTLRLASRWNRAEAAMVTELGAWSQKYFMRY
ncbi:uncharacterized protein LOC119397946 [Rhipicephalus sanguineus]|uniref:uncharacterized protein LOC119397946 n=1 Tax=Rhipicephalus sanguineus TaxID=34632 RepID=UPI001893715C|nr:uncharacterized protein LOC119397946 [Rhipicephalus sanguineus]